MSNKEVYKVYFEQAMENYRFFGILRLQVVLLPLAIGGPLFTYFHDRIDEQRIDLFVEMPVYIIATCFALALIFFFNLYFQRQQKLCHAVADCIAQNLKYDTIMNIKSYKQLRMECGQKRFQATFLEDLKMDFVSWLILVIISLTFGFLGYVLQTSSGKREQRQDYFQLIGLPDSVTGPERALRVVENVWQKTGNKQQDQEQDAAGCCHMYNGRPFGSARGICQLFVGGGLTAATMAGL